MKKTILFGIVFILSISFASAIECSNDVVADYNWMDWGNGSLPDFWDVGEGTLVYDILWAKYANASLKSVQGGLQTDTKDFDSSNSLITWWNLSSPFTSASRWIGVSPSNSPATFCCIGDNTAGQSNLKYDCSSDPTTATDFNPLQNSLFQTMIQLNGSHCVFYYRNTTEQDWLKLASCAETTKGFVAVTLQASGGGTEPIHMDKIGVFNYTTEGECIEAVPPPPVPPCPSIFTVGNRTSRTSMFSVDCNGELNVTGNAIFKGDVTILGDLIGGSPLKIRGGLNVFGNSYFNGNLGIGVTNPTYPLEVAVNDLGLSIYSKGMFIAKDYITQTTKWNKSKKVWDYINDSDDYLTKGKIDYKKFYGYMPYNMKKDKSRPLIEYTNITYPNGTTVIYQNIIYPFMIGEEGVSQPKEVDLLRQAIFEITNELCDKHSFSWC